MRIAVVTGNPKPASRTHGVALALADVLAAELAPSATPAAQAPAAAAQAPVPAVAAAAPAHLVVDLAEHAPSLFDWSAAELSRLTAEVAAADVAIFASPT